jgi:hypothetical protein
MTQRQKNNDVSRLRRGDTNTKGVGGACIQDHPFSEAMTTSCGLSVCKRLRVPMESRASSTNIGMYPNSLSANKGKRK